MTAWRWEKMDRVSGIYVAGFDRFVKIGFSTRVGCRLRELETGTPEELILHRVIEQGTMQAERALHARFAALRIRNEWFRLESSLAEFAGQNPITAFESLPEGIRSRIYLAADARERTKKVSTRVP